MHTYMIILSYISNLSVSGVAPLNQVCFHQEWWLSSQSCLVTGGDTAKKNCTWDDSCNTSCHPLLGVPKRPIIQSARVLLPLFLKKISSPDKQMKQGLRISLHVQVQIHGLNIWLLLVLESKKITVFEESKRHAVMIPDVRTEIDDLPLDQNTS